MWGQTHVGGDFFEDSYVFCGRPPPTSREGAAQAVAGTVHEVTLPSGMGDPGTCALGMRRSSEPAAASPGQHQESS